MPKNKVFGQAVGGAVRLLIQTASSERAEQPRMPVRPLKRQKKNLKTAR